MYGSDHASHIHAESEAKHVSIKGNQNLDESESKVMIETTSHVGKKSLKSKSTLKNRDEVSISAHGTEIGKKSPKKTMKWNSTKAQSVNRARAEMTMGGISGS